MIAEDRTRIAAVSFASTSGYTPPATGWPFGTTDTDISNDLALVQTGLGSIIYTGGQTNTNA